MRQSRPARRLFASTSIVAVSLVAIAGCLPSPQPDPGSANSGEPTATSGPYPSFDPTPDPPEQGNVFESGVGFTVTATESTEPPSDDGGSDVTFEPVNVTDGDLGTAWKKNRDDWSFDDYLLITFEQPVTLSQVGLTPGFSSEDTETGVDNFTQNHRLCFARFTFSDGTEWEIELDPQERAVQSIPVEVRTQWVKVGDLYSCAGEQPPAEQDFLAISEVELIGAPAR